MASTKILKMKKDFIIKKSLLTEEKFNGSELLEIAEEIKKLSELTKGFRQGDQKAELELKKMMEDSSNE